MITDSWEIKSSFVFVSVLVVEFRRKRISHLLESKTPPSPPRLGFLNSHIEFHT